MKVNGVYKICDRPLIWVSTGDLNWPRLVNDSGDTAYLLAHPVWRFSISSFYPYFKNRRMLAKKRIKLVILSNSGPEHRLAKALGFDSRLLNQNLHACEHRFYVMNREKVFDAIYIASARPYKRMHLAEMIKSLYVVTYFWPDVRDKNGNWDLHGFEPRIAHADFNRRLINEEEINGLLNQSRCGLALSKTEGAMWAVMEYLYAGLPIVSTRSAGGRDFFFDDHFVKIVEDHPAAVKAGVDDLIQKRIDPALIRSETLKKVNGERKRFYDLIAMISGRHGIGVGEYQDFHDRVWGGQKGVEKTKIY